jgi:hypothetical protein
MEGPPLHPCTQVLSMRTAPTVAERKIESALPFQLIYTSCFFSTPYTISVALPVYTLNFAALAYTLHPPLGYFPGPCDVDCYAFVQVTLHNYVTL